MVNPFPRGVMQLRLLKADAFERHDRTGLPQSAPAPQVQ